MSFGWWIAGLLFIALAGCVVAYRRLKKELQQEKNEVNNLVERLTEIKQELLEVQARRKKLLSAATQALVIVESDFKISSANKVAKRLFGKPKSDMTLMLWSRQYQLQELVQHTMQGQKMPPIYFSFGERMLEAHARAIKERSEIVAVALAIHDITEVQQLSRARRDFVANISHELRTPLASIQLLTDTLLHGGLEEKEIALDLINKIAIQVDTLSQLAQEVLDLSLIESGKAPLRMASTPLKPIVQAQIKRHLPQADRKQLCLEVDVDEALTVLVDETSIGRVISNLIHNGIKFTERGGVTVSARKLDDDEVEKLDDPEGEWIEITVSDTGPGLSPDELTRIFERFYKVDRARNRKEAGTGLGLAIAKHIVEAHGGSIWADENGSNGAIFRLTLPTE